MESIDVQTLTPYPYQKLSSEDCIRLIYVKPFPGLEKTVQCKIKEFPLQKCPPFKALSYEWGPRDPSGLGWPLVVDEKYILVVRRNLQTALLLYSSRPEKDAIWIDAICINQRNLEERAQQVPRMRDIYAAASEVMLFLGQDPGMVFGIFNAITEICCWYGRHGRATPIFNEQHITIDAVVDGHVGDVSSAPPDEVFTLAGKLWDFSYFSRMWIFQEVVSAKNARLQCGIWSLPWQIVEGYLMADSLVTNARSKGFTSTSYKGISPHALADTRIAVMVGSGLWPKSRFELLYMLQATRQLQATEKHDKVYAVLGITTSPVLPALQPDYKISWQTIYTRAASFIIDHMGNLDLLEDVEVMGKTRDLPSWVPNWQTFPPIRSGFCGVDYMLMSAGGGTKVRRRELDDPAHLALQGVQIGHIRTVGICTTNTSTEPQAFEFVHRTVLKEFEQLPTHAHTTNTTSLYPFTDEPIQLAYTRTRFCSEFPYRQFNPSSHFIDPDTGEVAWPAVSRILFTANHTSTSTSYADPQNPTSSVNEDIQSSLLQQSANKVFFTTENGHMGMAPPVVQADDIVFVLLGGRFPVVLRPAKGETDTTSPDLDVYSLVCLCYVHGLMNGEALRRPAEDHSDAALSQDKVMSSRASSSQSDQELLTTTELNDLVLV